MHYLVLGPLEIRDGSGALIPIRRGRPRSFLHLLLMQRRVVLPVEVVADRLWERGAPSDASNAVHQLVSYVRRALGPVGRERLVTSQVGYQLDVPDEQVDAWRFDRMVHAATQDLGRGTPDALQRAMRTAADAALLWRGDPYPESSGFEWSTGDINRLKENYLQLQETRLDAMLGLGRHREVVLEAQSLAAAYPLHERFHAQQALALYRLGRQSEALDVLRALRKLLDDEMALDPGPSAQRLEQQILQQDPELEPPHTGPVGAVSAGDGPKLSDTARVPQEEASAPTVGFPEPRPPSPPPRLLGRAPDIDQLVEHLRPGVTLTLTGPAGIGKSALARHLAHTWDPPVWFVDLSNVDRPELAPAAVARQTGFTGQLPADPTTVLVTGFRDAVGLLVLDTCEHLLPSLSTMVERIREEAPSLTILATSRRPLDQSDEMIHRLHPLDVPPQPPREADGIESFASVQLFVDRARRVRSDFRLDSLTADDVAEVVRTVEGVPLAIELAAANADVMSAAMIRERLAQHLDDAAPARSRPVRQTSLRAALDASRVLLGERERELFDTLAAFHGSFGLDAVRAVVENDFGDPYQPLASLVRQSLVTHDGGPTYRLLRPVRAYAADRLDESPDKERILRRHAISIAERSRVASAELRTSRDALTRLHDQLADARAAMDWALGAGRLDLGADIAVAYAWYWAINGLATEGMRWLHTVLDSIESADSGAPLDANRHGAVLRSLGLLANPMGRVQDARDYCRRAIELSSSCGDEVGTTAALLTLGIAEWALGELDAAAATHDRALQKALVTGERWHRTSAMTLRARTALDAAEQNAEELLERAVAAAQDDDEQQLLSISLTLLGHHHLRANRTVPARIAAERALEASRSIHYREGELGALNLLGRAELATGMVGEATDRFAQALSTAAEVDHRGALCETLESMALAAAASGRPEHAYLLLLSSERERTRLGLHMPSFGASDVAEVRRSTAAALGSAAEDVDARVAFLKLDELVRELLSVDD